MDYTNLSKEFLQTIYKYYQMKSQPQFSNAMHGETFVLQYIATHTNATVPSDIKNAMSISSARIATVLNSLEDKGLITRQIDSQDRRRTILRLTEEGEKKADASSQELLGLAKRRMEYLGEEDAKNCIRIMNKFIEACKHDKELR